MSRTPHVVSFAGVVLAGILGALMVVDARWAVGAASAMSLLVLASARTSGGSKLRRRHVALVWGVAFSSLLPVAVAAPLYVFLAAWILGEWFGSRRRGASVVLLITLIVAFWILISFHPNVPSLKIGFLGVYKSVFPLFGLVLGLAVDGNRRRSLVGHIIASLAVVLASSIVVHQYFPAWEFAMSRSAGADTGLYNNEARLQGVLPGPFHVAMAASIVILWGIQIWGERRRLASAVLAVASVAIFLAYVRTAYVALAVAVPLLLIRNREDSRRLTRLGVVVVVGVLLVLAAGRSSDQAEALLESLTQPVDDQRLVNRGAYYAQGIDMFARSPLLGWGAGSAGDTLSTHFASGEHVNSHNLLLKIAVEGGVVGITLWSVLLAVVLRSVKRRDSFGSLAFGILALLGVFGLTGSAIEAMPVTFLALAIVGVACAPSRDGPPPGEPALSNEPSQVTLSSPAQRERFEGTHGESLRSVFKGREAVPHFDRLSK